MDTERLRRILHASLPAGARTAELFIESRLSLSITMSSAQRASPDPPATIERRWESGAHLRRFSEGRHESFVLDAPTPESLEALCLHPDAVALDWLAGGGRLGVSRPEASTERLEASLTDASPSARSGPWSEPWLTSSVSLLRRRLEALEAEAAAAGLRARCSAGLEAQLQEILVLATDRETARDTRRFVDLTLRANLRKDGRDVSVEQTRSGGSLEELERGGVEATGDAATLAARARRSLEAVGAPRGEMAVVFASPSGGFLLHEICGHLLEADHVLRGASAFGAARGRAVASRLLSLADDGSLPGMRGSCLFDDEGVAARRTPLIMEGTLVGYLSDRLTAFVTGGISTGNGRRQSYRDAPLPRMTNLVIDSGQETFEEILRRTGSGLLVTRLGRGRVDPATGRFTLAVQEAFLIEQGRAGAPVAAAVLRGDATKLLPAIDAVGCDPRADTGAPRCIKEDQAVAFGILQPTLRVRSVMVGGADP